MRRRKTTAAGPVRGPPLVIRIWWRLLRLVGADKRAWDSQYRYGLWRADQGGRSVALLAMLVDLCDGGRLVELGCGEGSLPRQLPPAAFSTYHGIDISEVAIDRARAAIRQTPIRTRCEFECGDIACWRGESGVAVIVAEECLYYLPRDKQRALLQRCAASLRAKRGRIVVVVHSESKHRATLETVRACLCVEEERRVGARSYVIARAPPDPS